MAEWIKLWYIYTMEYYLAINIDKFISVAVWNEDSLSLSPWKAEMDAKCRGKMFLWY